MSGLPILYSFRRCPYAMRARMALLSSGQTVELREVLLRDKPTEMLAASPKATVPVLVMPDGTVIDESLDIMHWALAQNDPDGWLTGDDPCLIRANDGPFKAALDRYKYPGRYGLPDGLAHRLEGMKMLHDLDNRLSASDFLMSRQMSLADVALFPFVRQFAATDQTWFRDQPVPALQGWLARMLALPLFQAAMIRLPQWRSGEAGHVFHLTDD